MDLSRPCPEEQGIFKKNRKTKFVGLSQPESLQEGNRLRWEAHRLLHAERDQKIVERYKENFGYREIAAEFGIAYSTTMKIIQRAAERGEVEIRRKGLHASKLRAGGS